MLTDNDIYKKIKIALAFKDQITMHIFELEGVKVTRSFCKFIAISEDRNDFRELKNKELAIFLDGLLVCRQDLIK